MMYFTRMTVPVFMVISSLTVGLLAGCGSTSDKKKHAYRNAESIKSIEMPPGLEMARGNESLEIPEQKATKIASIDELEKPPKIIESVDLEMLDDKNAKPARKEKTEDDKSPIEKEDDGEGGSVTVVKTKSEPPSITATKNTNGDSLLIVESDFDRVWPLVQPALIELGFKIDDASRGGQVYAISKDLPKLNLSDEPVHPGDVEPEVKEEYQIHVKSQGEKTEITVHNKLGQIEGSGLADHLLLQIKELMENPKKASGNNS
jgi:uncharacterized lipoprotein